MVTQIGLIVMLLSMVLALAAGAVVGTNGTGIIHVKRENLAFRMHLLSGAGFAGAIIYDTSGCCGSETWGGWIVSICIFYVLCTAFNLIPAFLGMIFGLLSCDLCGRVRRRFGFSECCSEW